MNKEKLLISDYYRKIPVFNPSKGEYRRYDGTLISKLTEGDTMEQAPLDVHIGFMFFDKENNRPVWKGYANRWYTSEGYVHTYKKSGAFADRPIPVDPAFPVPIGFPYFCTDKQTSEGVTNGIMIYHKGNDVWVDALGRVVS